MRRSFPSDEPIKHSLESDQNLIFVLQVDVLPWQRKCFKATPGLLSLPRSSILVLKGFEVRYRLALLLLALAVPAAAQDRGADMRTAFVRVQHLKHGINASEWFAQHASDYSAAFTGRYTDEADIALMAKLGFDNVRLSIDPVPLEQSMNHWGSSNGDFLARLDRAVDAMLANGLAVQIDITPKSPTSRR